MADVNKLSVKTMIIYAAVVMVVAFVGVVAGNWFVEWRRGSSDGPSIEGWLADNRSALLMGDEFPNEEVMALDGTIDSTGNLVRGSKTLVLFLSPGCKPCEMAIEMYKEEFDQLSPEVRVIGLCTGDTTEARAYQAETGFPFPMYCDQYYLFAQQYDVSQFPSMAGVTADGRVSFLVHGFRDDFKLADAFDFIGALENQGTISDSTEGS